MGSLKPVPIIGYASGGLVTNKKPLLIADEAFSVLENAYVYRDRVPRREGNKLLGRLSRQFTSINYFLTGASPWTFSLKVVTGYILTANNANPGQITTTFPHSLSNGDLVIITGVVGAVGYNNTTFTVTVVDTLNFTVGVNAGAFGAYVSGGFWVSNRSLAATEPSAEIVPGSFSMTIAGTIFTDANADGLITSNLAGNFGYINYNTGSVTLTHTKGVGVATVLSYFYYPSLPVMGITEREISGINSEQTVFFDTKYAYIWNSTNLVEFITGTTWSGTDSDFFWTTNYRGAVDSTRLFFATNFVNSAANPMRYTDGATWTTFAPLSSATDTIFQARIIIPYYGRLLLLNTWEGTTAGGNAGAANFFNRCAFSQIGSPIAADAFQRDIVGKGGSIDAPTNEEIIGAAFIKNTLMVFFEQTTWQLRYVGEYGIPFIWERVSADLGSESTFSTVIFDQGALVVGDKAIISANPSSVNRIDLNIPDQIFAIRNPQDGVKRVQGVRNFQKELVYWTYSDFALQRKFPNKVLIYNYRNNTWARFRDNVTAFGTFLLTGNAVTLWDSTDVFWDDEEVTWDDVQTAGNFPSICSGNQEGFIHIFGETSLDEPSLSVTGIDLTTSPIQVTVVDHNLEDGDFVYMVDMQFINTTTSSPVSTNLNDTVYKVQRLPPGTSGENDIIGLMKWDGSAFVYLNYTNFPSLTPAIGASTYVGGGTLSLIPKLDVQTKDFNPFLSIGSQTKMSYLDFLMDATGTSGMTVNIFLNTSPAVSGNMLVGNRELSTVLTSPFYVPASDIAWFRFYATLAGQFYRIQMTYSDELMNDIRTNQEKWVLNAIVMYVQQAGKSVF